MTYDPEKQDDYEQHVSLLIDQALCGLRGVTVSPRWLLEVLAERDAVAQELLDLAEARCAEDQP